MKTASKLRFTPEKCFLYDRLDAQIVQRGEEENLQLKKVSQLLNCCSHKRAVTFLSDNIYVHIHVLQGRTLDFL